MNEGVKLVDYGVELVEQVERQLGAETILRDGTVVYDMQECERELKAIASRSFVEAVFTTQGSVATDGPGTAIGPAEGFNDFLVVLRMVDRIDIPEELRGWVEEARVPRNLRSYFSGTHVDGRVFCETGHYAPSSTRVFAYCIGGDMMVDLCKEAHAHPSIESLDGEVAYTH
jgi:hypothetical protein